MNKPKFYIGQKVNHRSFVDCFQKHHDAITGLHVAEIKKINPVGTMQPWYRVTAIGEDGRGYVKAAESFFEADEPEPVEIESPQMSLFA
jgi:heat shock protein HspQ